MASSKILLSVFLAAGKANHHDCLHPLTKTALEICLDAHKDQVDKAGMPYFLHPLHVAETVEGGEVSVATALLHDVVEDTDLTFDDLCERGITEDVINALKLLTHDDAVPYEDYIESLKSDFTAVAVKLADLKRNMDLTRYDDEWDANLEKQMKYRAAYDELYECFHCEEDSIAGRLMRAEANIAAAMGATDDAKEALAFAYSVGSVTEKYAKRKTNPWAAVWTAACTSCPTRR